MTQCERVVDYIKRKGSITTREAFVEFGCARLASRINDLKKQGYKFKTETVSALNCFGEKVHFTRYSFN